MGAWAQARLPGYVGWGGYFQAIGYEKGGELKGAVVYTHASSTNIMASIVLEAPFTKKFLTVAFWYPFGQLGMRRITAMVEEWNERSRLLCEHLGFKVEGRLREAAADGGDVLLLGILRHECRFFRP